MFVSLADGSLTVSSGSGRDWETERFRFLRFPSSADIIDPPPTWQILARARGADGRARACVTRGKVGI